ncbi:MAG: hypothetical protein QOF41_1127 [Methylobacteriaceae bacterium]|nr:hypothetical protein [Methylobacteriaceae bacterium]
MPEAESLKDKVAVEEFKILRGEIELRGSEQRAMERYVILADAAIYGVLVFPKEGQNAGSQALHQLAWFLPPIIGFLALIRWRESVTMIDYLAEYLRRRERQINAGDVGWEWFLHREKRNEKPIGLFARTYVLFWWIVIGGTGVLACLQYSGGSALGILSALVVGGGVPLVLFRWLGR